MTHAFFKALLFLGAGSVIHAWVVNRIFANMGGLAKRLKITYVTFFIGCLAIAGIPPFSGFFSKDAILLSAYQHNDVLYVVGVLRLHAYCFLYVPFLIYYVSRILQGNRRTTTSYT